MSEDKSDAVEVWDPFREIDLLRGWPSIRSLAGLRGAGLPESARWFPSMDVSESDSQRMSTWRSTTAC